MNTEEDVKIVHSGTVIGQLSEVDRIETSSPDERSQCTNELRADLAELLQKSEKNLTPLQKKKAKDFF
jgi:hypothetical protein